jgi:hypothetical protein
MMINSTMFKALHCDKQNDDNRMSDCIDESKE